jgi:hypothetical protein
MAVLSTKGLSGQIGKQLVFKASGGKTIVSAYVGPRKKKATELQQLFRECFKRAQKRASHDSRKKEVKARCTSYLKEGQSIYHFLMGLYQREEVQRMKECKTGYKTLEELLIGEPKRRKEVMKSEPPKIKKKVRTVWYYPVRTQEAIKADHLPATQVMINRTFYGGWVSTYSG